MVLNLRSIAVGAALVLALGALGWFAVSNGDAPDSNARAGAAGGMGSQRPGDAPGGFGPGAPVGVLVAQVSRVPFALELEAVGNARANEAVDITAKISNRITL